MNVYFGSSGKNMPHISPVEYENALGRNRSLRSSRELSRKDSEQILECSPDKTHFFPGKMQRLDQYPSDRAGEENHIDDALEGLVAQEFDGLMKLKPALGQYLIYGPPPGTPFYERVMRDNLMSEKYAQNPDLYNAQMQAWHQAQG